MSPTLAFARLSFASLMRSRIDVDADGARAVFLRRGDRNPAVAGSEVVDHVVGRHVRHLQHGFDDVLRRRHVDDVRIAQRLAGARAIPGPAAGCRRSRRRFGRGWVGSSAAGLAGRLAHAEPTVNATPSAATTLKSLTRIFATPFTAVTSLYQIGVSARHLSWRRPSTLECWDERRADADLRGAGGVGHRLRAVRASAGPHRRGSGPPLGGDSRRRGEEPVSPQQEGGPPLPGRSSASRSRPTCGSWSR